MNNLNHSNQTLQLNYLNFHMKSNSLLEFSRKLNIFSTLFVVALGLVGHSLIIFVFGQKRFRTNSSNVFLLCLAINDSLFLIIHLFEDTIRTYKEMYINAENFDLIHNRIIQMFNLTDRYAILCHLVNYLRYTLRFISSYILVVFTLQRVSIVFSPFSNKFKSKKSAWICCLLITLLAFLANSWAPFFFKLKSISKNIEYCDIDKKWVNEYFQITTIYICLTMLIPIIVIFVSNSLIILSLLKAESNRTTSLRINNHIQKQCSSKVKSLSNALSVSNANMRSSVQSSKSVSVHVKPHYSSVTHLANHGGVLNNRKSSSKHSTKILLLISFVFVCLNLPYLVTWFVFYYQIESNKFDHLFASNDYLFAAVQITEIIHLINYAILFYVYCASGAKFRNQLKYSRMYYLDKKKNSFNF